MFKVSLSLSVVVCSLISWQCKADDIPLRLTETAENYQGAFQRTFPLSEKLLPKEKTEKPLPFEFDYATRNNRFSGRYQGQVESSGLRIGTKIGSVWYKVNVVFGGQVPAAKIYRRDVEVQVGNGTTVKGKAKSFQPFLTLVTREEKISGKNHKIFCEAILSPLEWPQVGYAISMVLAAEKSGPLSFRQAFSEEQEASFKKLAQAIFDDCFSELIKKYTENAELRTVTLTSKE